MVEERAVNQKSLENNQTKHLVWGKDFKKIKRIDYFMWTNFLNEDLDKWKGIGDWISKCIED